MKNPGHIAQIEALLIVFPDACIVQTHRDPLKAIPSLCSTLHMSRRMFEGEAARPEVLGPRECAYWQRAVQRTEHVRRSRPEQLYDVDHRKFHADPLGTVRGIYDYFGLTLSADAEQLMRQWIARNPTAAHGEHRYQVASYGINEQRIRDDSPRIASVIGFLESDPGPVDSVIGAATRSDRPMAHPRSHGFI